MRMLLVFIFLPILILMPKNMMLFFLKVLSYSKTERIKRLIEISVKGESATGAEMLELSIIQAIRLENGEIDAIVNSRNIVDDPE